MQQARPRRPWTIYLAQDKHLDYNWCGTTPEIEARAVELLDYYLERAEKNRLRWNLDGTIWVEIYRRHRGEKGHARLLEAIRHGRIGYAANYAVLLWGLMSTELSIRALYDSASIARTTGRDYRLALVMENPGLPAGVATILSDCGITRVGRGILNLRAETYSHRRDPYPLFQWQAPNGLVFHRPG